MRLKQAIWIPAVCCVILSAQNSRESYRRAYSDWRQQDPNLELDLATPNSNPQLLAARVHSVVDAAQRYCAEHAAFLRASAEAFHKETARFAEPVKIDSNITPGVDFHAFTAAEIKSDDTNLKIYEKDRSQAIAQIRQAIERERAALVSLNNTMDRRAAVSTKASAAQDGAERARAAMAQDDIDLDQSILEDANLANLESQAWLDYYQQLANVVAPTVTPAAVPAPLPSLEYTGDWTFSENGAFTGIQPEFADLAVHDDDGVVKGSFYARFRLPSGEKGDPTVRFDFSGLMTSEQTQHFALQTNDGEGGYIELTRGHTPSELEVNFYAPFKAVLVQQANLVMRKR